MASVVGYLYVSVKLYNALVNDGLPMPSGSSWESPYSNYYWTIYTPARLYGVTEDGNFVLMRSGTVVSSGYSETGGPPFWWLSGGHIYGINYSTALSDRGTSDSFTEDSFYVDQGDDSLPPIEMDVSALRARAQDLCDQVFSEYPPGYGVPTFVAAYPGGEGAEESSLFWGRFVGTEETAPNNRLTKLAPMKHFPEQLAQAAQPYRPAKAAWTEKKTTRVCQWVVTQAAREEQVVLSTVYNPDGTVKYYVPIVSPARDEEREQRCENVTEVINHPEEPARPAVPAIEYIPASTRADYNLGWNSSARSNLALPQSAVYKFKVPSALGVVTGLSNASIDSGYKDISHGFYIASGVYQIMESGTVLTTSQPYSPDAQFKISRSGGTVTYSVDDEIVYVSTKRSGGPIFVDASAYSGFDSIVSPYFKAEDEPTEIWDGRLRPVSGFAGEDENVEGGAGELSPITSDALDDWAYERADGVLRPVAGMTGDYEYEGARGELQRLVGDAGDGAAEPAFEVANGFLMPVHGSAICIEGETSNGVGVLRPIVGMSGDYDYQGGAAYLPPIFGYSEDGRDITPVPPGPIGRIDATLPRLTGEMFGSGTIEGTLPRLTAELSGTTTLIGRIDATLPALEAELSGVVDLIGRIDATLPALTAEMFGGGTISGTLPALEADLGGMVGAGGVIDATLPALTAELHGTTGIVGFIDAVLPWFEPPAFGHIDVTFPRLQAWLAGEVGDTPLPDEAYCTNLRTKPELAQRGAGSEMTRFTQFPVLQVLRLRGQYYALTVDGLHRIEGGLDAGAPIPWKVSTGTTDFGARELKHIVSAYVGGRFGPGAKFDVHEGEKRDVTYSYTTPRGQTAQNYRQMFGKGLRARYFSFTLKGDDEFELDGLQFEVGASKRRL